MISKSEDILQTGAQHTDLTLIFNQHATPEDASLSASYVLPDSLVYLEGFPSNEGSDRISADRFLKALNEIRFVRGKDDAVYRKCRNIIIGNCEKYLETYEPNGQNEQDDFLLHNSAEVRELLLKDCIVSYADHKDDITLIDNLFPSFDIDPNENPDVAVGRFEERVGEKLRTNFLRERACVRTVLQCAQVYAATPATDANIRKENGVQFSTYVKYGTAHARSLASVFAPYIASPRIIEAKQLPEYEYMDPIAAPGYDNLPRRIGHDMLTELTSRFAQSYDREMLLESAYQELEWLNTADDNSRAQFQRSAVRVAYEIQTNPSNSPQLYKKLFRDFMPGMWEDQPGKVPPR